MRVLAVVERFEEDVAVLRVGPDKLKASWPVSLFPDRVYEGAIFAFSVGRDRAAEAEMFSKIKLDYFQKPREE